MKTMLRRNFIKNGSAMVMGFLIPLPKLFADKHKDNEDAEVWTELIEYARWSPSPHNVQPWRLKVLSKTKAELYYDTSRLLVYTDPTSCFTIIGLGMFITCLDIAAAPLGYRVIAQHEPEERLSYTKSGLQLFATLDLVQKMDQIRIDRELIRKRKTSRLHYEKKKIAPHILESLSSVASENGMIFSHSADKQMVDFVLNLNKETLFYDLDEDLSRKELSKWIRTTEAEAQEKKDGLWSFCMRFPGKLMHDFFFHHERFKSAWKRKIIGDIYKKSMKGTAHIAWITGKFETRHDWLNAGNMLQKLWLEMTKYNVYLHPFGSVVTNPSAHQKFKNKIKLNDDKDNQLWLLLRMGYSDEPPRSYRLHITDILIP